MDAYSLLFIIAGLSGILILIVFILMIKLAAIQKNTSQDKSEYIFKLMDNMRQDMQNNHMNSRSIMEEKFNFLNKSISNSTDNNFRTIQNQFKQSASLIKDVTERLVNIDKTNKQVLDFSKQMQTLENILKNPKQRGVLGEYFLETLLSNVLQPNQYKMQYSFKDGSIVDSVIFYREKVIPIDAKFSLEKYNLMMEEGNKKYRDELEKDFKRDVKLRIDETAKYINPSEGTTEFAFMFIPAEGVYYNLLIYNVGSLQVNTQDLIEYAFKKHVVIVSPTSFYAYLETVLQGLKAQKVEENVQQIIKRIGDLGTHLKNYEVYMQKLGNNLCTTVNSYNSATKEFKKVDKDIYKITDGISGKQVDLDLVEKPIIIDGE